MYIMHNPGGELNLVDWRFYRHAINFKSASDKLLCLCKKEAYISFYVSKHNCSKQDSTKNFFLC